MRFNLLKILQFGNLKQSRIYEYTIVLKFSFFHNFFYFYCFNWSLFRTNNNHKYRNQSLDKFKILLTINFKKRMSKRAREIEIDWEEKRGENDYKVDCKSNTLKLISCIDWQCLKLYHIVRFYRRYDTIWCMCAVYCLCCNVRHWYQKNNIYIYMYVHCTQ